MNRTAIIVAGGKGSRMGTDIPKQFLPIGGKPILMYTIEAFRCADDAIDIVLVLPHEQQSYWLSLCRQFHFEINCKLVDGGDTRYQSVKNGLALVPAEGSVAVHDGVRPFVSLDVIRRCFTDAEKYKAVVPVVDLIESVRKIVSMENSEAVDRSHYKIVQTPQVFDSDLLHRAYCQPYSSLFTDDASVVESLGCEIHLTDGNRENIKITTPFDMMMANAYLKWQK